MSAPIIEEAGRYIVDSIDGVQAELVEVRKTLNEIARLLAEILEVKSLLEAGPIEAH